MGDAFPCMSNFKCLHRLWVGGGFNIPRCSRRPFHPQRLLEALERPWPGVLRSKGFFWLATRHNIAGLWQSAGGAWRGDPGHASLGLGQPLHSRKWLPQRGSCGVVPCSFASILPVSCQRLTSSR